EEQAVGEPVDHRALEAVRADAAFELVGCRRRIDRRQRREAGEAGGMLGDRRREPVVDPPGERDRIVTAELLRRPRTMRDQLDVDPGLVHLLDAQVAEIMETLEHLVVARALDPRICRRQLGIPIVLLDRDDRTVRLLPHVTQSSPETSAGFLSSMAASVTAIHRPPASTAAGHALVPDVVDEKAPRE